MIYFHKILPLIVSPLFIILGLIILIIFSLPIVSNRLINHLEVNYQLSHVSEADTANAIVVLSGMVRTIKTEESFDYEWGEAADQIFAGIDLFKENKASFLILTRGKLPWSVGKPEGEYLRDVAIKLGVPK